jgi:hypothetical protein
VSSPPKVAQSTGDVLGFADPRLCLYMVNYVTDSDPTPLRARVVLPDSQLPARNGACAYWNCLGKKSDWDVACLGVVLWAVLHGDVVEEDE